MLTSIGTKCKKELLITSGGSFVIKCIEETAMFYGAVIYMKYNLLNRSFNNTYIVDYGDLELIKLCY